VASKQSDKQQGSFDWQTFLIQQGIHTVSGFAAQSIRNPKSARAQALKADLTALRDDLNALLAAMGE
jgi:hypothetical protein